MREIKILSPHRDDAVFSLFAGLTKWSALGLNITVENFFTISAYAPRAGFPLDTTSVTALRKREDRRALALFSGSIERIDHDLLDAPLRLNIDSSTVCNPETRSLLGDDLIHQLTQLMHSCRPDLYLAPLALGNHIDHLAVREAATRSVPANRLAFYEDLPYAIRTSKQELHRRVAETEGAVRAALEPLLVRAPHCRAFHKRRAVAQYQSQITLAEANAIAAWGNRYLGGERIWVTRRLKRNFLA